MSRMRHHRFRAAVPETVHTAPKDPFVYRCLGACTVMLTRRAISRSVVQSHEEVTFGSRQRFDGYVRWGAWADYQSAQSCARSLKGPSKEIRTMKRKTFDMLLSAGGVVVVVVLIVAGSLLTWGSNFIGSQVTSQLSAQKIYFPPASAFAHAKAGTEITPSMEPYLLQYAGQQMTTGAQAEAYANHFISVHLSEMPYGGVYATASAAALADPKNASTAALVNTIFKGTTLRGLLLSTYAFWQMGQIAGDAALASFILAGVMLLLVVFGLLHYRRAPEVAEL